jgi:Holliday junction resolvase
VRYSRKRRDDNERPIIGALRSAGCSVFAIDDGGIPDLLVGYEGVTYLLEVKLPLGVEGGKSHRELTPRQTVFFQRWVGGPCIVVRSVDEALKAIKGG